VTPPELREAPVQRAGLRCYELAAWGERHGLLAGVTARDADFGLASAGPAREMVDRWLGLRGAFAPAFDAVVVARQCHGTGIAVHKAPGPGWHVLDTTDGHVTSRPGLLLTVTVADCVPVYVVHRGGRWLGLLHAGWRGVARGIVEAGIATCARRARCPRHDIVIHCGVSICGSCYEVGPEVVAAVTGRPATGPGQLDLRAEIARRAAGAGVTEVTVSPWCTAHDRATFYSHRRSHGSDGRMVAYLGRPSA
jgi:YfiH family protein